MWPEVLFVTVLICKISEMAYVSFRVRIKKKRYRKRQIVFVITHLSDRGDSTSESDLTFNFNPRVSAAFVGPVLVFFDSTVLTETAQLYFFLVVTVFQRSVRWQRV